MYLLSLKKSCTKMKNDRRNYSSPRDIVFTVLVLTLSKHGSSFKLFESLLEYLRYLTLQTWVLLSHVGKEVNLKLIAKINKEDISIVCTYKEWNRKVPATVIFTLGIVHNDRYEKGAWKKKNPYCAKIPGSEAFSVGAEVAYFLHKEWKLAFEIWNKII